MTGPPLRSTLFPYTTLFRSGARVGRGVHDRGLDPEGVRHRDARLRGRRVAPDPGRLWLHGRVPGRAALRSEEHTSELQSLTNLVCRLLLEKKKQNKNSTEQR